MLTLKVKALSTSTIWLYIERKVIPATHCISKNQPDFGPQLHLQSWKTLDESYQLALAQQAICNTFHVDS